MVNEEDYLQSLAKLQNKENLSIVATENGIKFLKDYELALEQSKTNNKKILLCFHMKGCDGCNVVNYILNNNNIIKNILDNYIVLFYSINDTKTKLIQQYNVYSYPACYIINSNEKVLKQKIGIKVLNGPENDILNWLNS